MRAPETFLPEQDPTDLGHEIYEKIESSNWAPWLRVISRHLVERIKVFPAGHLVVKEDDGNPMGFLSTNRISWDGNRGTLTTWDAVAGREGNYQDTYVPDGNTICLMSMGVAAGAKGQHIAQAMVAGIQKIGQQKGIEHIIGDFRPSGFGQYKNMVGDFDFARYVETRREDGLPLDPWLRNVGYLGMQALKVDNRAMIVPASAEALDYYMRVYKPEAWYEVHDPAAKARLLEQQQPQLDLAQVTHIYECEETGTWYLDAGSGQAVYIESNYWGELPL